MYHDFRGKLANFLFVPKVVEGDGANAFAVPRLLSKHFLKVSGNEYFISGHLKTQATFFPICTKLYPARARTLNVENGSSVSSTFLYIVTTEFYSSLLPHSLNRWLLLHVLARP